MGRELHCPQARGFRPRECVSRLVATVVVLRVCGPNQSPEVGALLQARIAAFFCVTSSQHNLHQVCMPAPCHFSLEISSGRIG